MTCSTRNFAAGAPNRCWVADITYLRTWQGWLYLVAVQDLYSRRIVGWAMADHLRAELVTDALEMALAHRRPGRGLIWHSDQGSQFVSLAFGQKARAAGIAQSMGSKGDCFDNAVAESFFATLKKELIHRRSWPTKAELRTEVFDYIETFYNRERRRLPGRNRLPGPSRGRHGSYLTDCLIETGALLNRMEENGARLNRRRLSDAYLLARALDTRPGLESQSQSQIRRRAGAIQESVLQALAATDRPLRAREIHGAAEKLAGTPLSWNTVKDCLHKNARRHDSPIERVGHGRYRHR